MAGQLVPDNAHDFVADRAALVAALAAHRPDVTLAYHAFNPYPWAITGPELAELEKISRALRRAACAVVENYLTDRRLQTMILLPPRVVEWLRLAADRPYTLGAIRPDFLHAVDGTPIVNEINARFPLNGFLVSEAMTAALAEMPYQSRLPGDFEPIPGLACITGALEQIVGNRESLIVVKGIERGYDMRLLVDHWKLPVVTPAEAAPSMLADRFAMLELHQHEMLDEVSPEAMTALARDGRHLNDVRTVFLVHDKRLLVVMTSDIVRDYVSGEDLATLARHVAPTFVVGLNDAIREEASERQHEWVLKPNLLGKAEGVVVGALVTVAEWKAALDSADPRWVLQRYVRQREFAILSAMDGEVAVRPMNVIGLLPSLNDECFGPGIYRAGRGPIVNVAGGGTILAPVIAAPSPLAGEGRGEG
jgi:hypothetical protein